LKLSGREGLVGIAVDAIVVALLFDFVNVFHNQPEPTLGIAAIVIIVPNGITRRIGCDDNQVKQCGLAGYILNTIRAISFQKRNVSDATIYINIK
jgi:hypothetical protein